MKTGIIIVDHGSRRAQSNALLEEVAVQFGKRFAERYDVVEPAHMEIAEPSIASAYAKCVARGATRVVVCPFFLGPGKHWTSDIPALTRAAAADHPGTTYHVTMPLGLDDLILDLLAKRVGFCDANQDRCESCRGSVRSGEIDVTLPESTSSHGAGGAPSTTCSSCPYVAAGIALPNPVAAH